jgi:pimeloyl-ACP methyl ester carboxylesterase
VVELAARLPEARPREVAEAGHMLPSEAPEAVIEACLELARDP